MSQSVHVTVSFEWIEVGRVSVDSDGKTAFPLLPLEPGIYKLSITETNGATSLYIGETDELRRRFAHYRNPGPTQPTNQRINALLKQILTGGGRATLAIATKARLEIDGVANVLDLSKKASRLLAENAALVKGRWRAWTVSRTFERRRKEAVTDPSVDELRAALLAYARRYLDVLRRDGRTMRSFGRGHWRPDPNLPDYFVPSTGWFRSRRPLRTGRSFRSWSSCFELIRVWGSIIRVPG